MRLIFAAGAAAAVIAAGLATTPVSASSLGPVGKVTVTPSTGNDGTAYVDVSWASEPSNADGALVCLHRGTTAIQQPSKCESRIPVDSPGLDSGLITIHPGKDYVVEVFSYQSSSPVVYGPPVSRFRHGVKVGMSSRCSSQTAGSTCTVSATVTNASTGGALGNRKVELWQSRVQQPAHWTLVATKTTASSGLAQAAITLQKTHLYQWHYAAPHSHELPSNSARVEIVVTH